MALRSSGTDAQFLRNMQLRLSAHLFTMLLIVPVAIGMLKQSTVDNIIRGTSKNPKVRTLHKISNVFGMTLSEFLDFPELNNYSFDDEEDSEQ